MDINGAKIARASVELKTKIGAAAFEHLLNWYPELFDYFEPWKVEYINLEDYENENELCEAYGYDTREEMENDYLIIEDAAFPGFLVIE